MYLGQLVETASRDALFAQPRHPYTQALLAAVPTLDPHAEPVAVVQGEIPDPRIRRPAVVFLTLPEGQRPLSPRNSRAACDSRRPLCGLP